MTTSKPNHARTLGKLGGTLLRAAALALTTLPSAWAYSSVELTVGGTRYTVAFTQQRTYNQCIYAITHAPWWGHKTLAQDLAAALGGRLGAPTAGTYGPLFAFQTYGAGPNGVDNAAWNISNFIATSNGNGWPVNSNGVYAVDPSQVDSTGNCTVTDLQTAAPFLESVTPASGTTAGGTAITLSGNNFTGATAVTIGGAAASNVHVVNDTTITATTPAGTVGSQSVRVTTPSGTNSANTLFTYKQAQTGLTALATPGTIAVGETSALSTTGGAGGGAVSFQLDSGPCTLAGNQLTGAAQGTCTVTATKAADNSYLAATTTANVAVVPTPVNATCTSLPATSFKPVSGLCSAGTLNPAGVSRAANQWAWTCDGAHGGNAAACTADLGATGNQSGLAAVELGTGGWVLAPQGNGALETAGFIPVSGHPKSPPNLPPGYSFPHALFDFVLTGGTGAATLTITYPASLPAGAVYWKYGPSPAGYNCTGTACAAPHWYQMPPNQAVVTGNTVTLTIYDGGVGDDDLDANGVIVDQGGPGIAQAAPASGAAPIPTLSEWALAALTAAMLLLSLRQARHGWRQPRS